MRMNHYPETDSLYLDLTGKPSVESREVSEGIVLDYAEDRRLAGIDIDNASHKIDRQEITLSQRPAPSDKRAA